MKSASRRFHYTDIPTMKVGQQNIKSFHVRYPALYVYGIWSILTSKFIINLNVVLYKTRTVTCKILALS
jgi:hypothetical protein